MPNKYPFLILLIFLFISCSHSPKGTYEGQIGTNSIVLDFTMDNIVIVKTASIFRIRHVEANKKSLYYEKTKCYWLKSNKIISIYNKEKIRLFSFKIQDQDLIDKESGERLSHKL